MSVNWKAARLLPLKFRFESERWSQVWGLGSTPSVPAKFMNKPTIEDEYDSSKEIDIEYFPNWTPHYHRSSQKVCFRCKEQGEYLVRNMYHHMWIGVDLCGVCVYNVERSTQTWCDY